MNFKYLLLLFLVSCTHEKFIICDCPKPIDYSHEFQKNLVHDLEKIDSYYINQVVIDWFNLNKELMKCYE